ncbi:ABC transporter substrate-binding protein [Rhodocytophaga aerolata]|uniref:ABC transporter substrate-binding protein n=1 Tax=Rhodocytophaga aerolata TaxID=455078 RepID=A0ABT8R736_9BACT|nr:ABC transporter substrate-binding protein [Rhodocytophaga aerolata]MDO1447769.1 ABC transporter substrate-binding protein [Rhodocytophaga aerolata]
MIQRFFLFFCLFMLSSLAFAQNAKEYQRKFESGKELLKQEKYALAKEVFTPLTQQNPANPYSSYANYYLAYAHFKTGKLDNARLQLTQLLERNPTWPDAENAYYLLANIAFEKKDMAAGFGQLEKIKNKQIREEADNLKKHYLAQVTDLAVLKNLQKKYPEDKALASVVVDKLLMSPNADEVKLAQQLDAKFKFGKVKELEEQKKVSVKDEYNVAVLFPFQPDNLLVTDKPRNNQFALDMYVGIKMAQEQLAANGVKINVYAYDIGSDGDKMLNLINQPEFSAMDLLIGPLYSASNKVAVSYANDRNIALINPISTNAQLVENNPAAYLFQPSVEQQVKQAADYAFASFDKKPAVIFFGATPKDSSIAHNYRRFYEQKGGKVSAITKLSLTDVANVSKIFEGLTNETTGHVFISTDNTTIVANFINALERKSSTFPVFTLPNWLEQRMISFEQLERRNVHVIYPEYIDYNADTVQAFRKNYIARRNIVPSIYSYQGYDMMLFFGQLMAEHGTFFHQALHQQPPVRGVIMAGYNYNGSNINQYVPLVKFDKANLILVNPISP